MCKNFKETVKRDPKNKPEDRAFIKFTPTRGLSLYGSLPPFQIPPKCANPRVLDHSPTSTSIRISLVFWIEEAFDSILNFSARSVSVYFSISDSMCLFRILYLIFIPQILIFFAVFDLVFGFGSAEANLIVAVVCFVDLF